MSASRPVLDAPPRSLGRGGSLSATTHRELPRVLPPSVPPVVELPLYSDDFDDKTEIGRIVVSAPAPKPSGADRVLLMRLDGSSAGEVHRLMRDVVHIGRHAANDLCVVDSSISRRHARLYAADGAWHVEDLGSANGSFLQGRRVERARLTHGDWIQLGPRVRFKFAEVDAAEERLLEQLWASSTRDPLTDAANRKHFDDRLAVELAHYRRHQTPVALVALDLDHFKAINDRWGHPAGDAVLKAVAASVRQRLRSEDLLARVGGEEFHVLLRGCDVRGAAKLAERLRAAVHALRIPVSDGFAPVTASFGCASLDELAEPSAATLIELADARLYDAKRSGRNRVVAS